MAKSDENVKHKVVVSIDGESIDLEVLGATAAEHLAAAVITAAEHRRTYVFTHDQARLVVNFAQVTRTLVEVRRGQGAGINIRR